MTALLVTRTLDGRIVDTRTVHGSRACIENRAETTRYAVAKARGLSPEALRTKTTPLTVLRSPFGEYLPTTPA